MPDSPISATPYEVLGVAPTATDDELKRAYRRALREAHPDTGGDAARFNAVQTAWERIGTPAGRAIYDRVGATREEPHSWATPRTSSKPTDTRPRARSYGHPGGWRRERYLTLIREWAGRGAVVEDPYDPALVASAPREIRHILADALAEEATARALTDLGIGFTAWHDVATGAPDEKIDHIVLGPTGLFAVLSEDFGGPARPRRGELIGDALAGEKPFESLGRRAKIISKAVGVKFTVLAIVLPDDALEEAFFVLGKSRGAQTVAVRQSHLPILLRDGLPDSPLYGGTELFEVRTRLQSGVRFVAP
ncbi:J domain-containing protein [Marisediminicola sp. LYQ134]|uniref:J domain-containing protein n=1 Tax=unclassified Marisediminicola TaxID=2618316 RepID=UPI0039834936